jgi:hypothetical protein
MASTADFPSIPEQGSLHQNRPCAILEHRFSPFIGKQPKNRARSPTRLFDRDVPCGGIPKAGSGRITPQPKPLLLSGIPL